MARTPTPNTATNVSNTDTTGVQNSQTSTTDNTGGETEGGNASEEDPDETVEARVTLEFEGHAVNDVAEIPAGRVDQLEREGYIDTHADAVAYAKSLVA